MIIIGYQGIGKTTLAMNDPRFIDLESTNTWYKENGERKRWPNWADIYANFAVDLSKYNHHVFVSSHQVVRDALRNHPDSPAVMTCVPAFDLKDQWIEKLEERYEKSRLDKDYRALMNAKDRYTENIQEIIDSRFPVLVLNSIDYDLASEILRFGNIMVRQGIFVE